MQDKHVALCTSTRHFDLLSSAHGIICELQRCQQIIQDLVAGGALREQSSVVLARASAGAVADHLTPGVQAASIMQTTDFDVDDGAPACMQSLGLHNPCA